MSTGILKLLLLFVFHKSLYVKTQKKINHSSLCLLLYGHRAELKPGPGNPHVGQFQASPISAEPRLRPSLTLALIQRQTELPEALLRAHPRRRSGHGTPPARAEPPTRAAGAAGPQAAAGPCLPAGCFPSAERAGNK